MRQSLIYSNDRTSILKRLLTLLKPYKKQIGLILACIVLSSTISVIMPLLGKSIMDDGLLPKNFHIVLKLSAALFLLVLLDQAIGLLETKYYAYVNSMMPYNLSKASFKHLLNLKLQYFKNIGFAEIMSNLSTDVANVARITDRSMFFLVSEVFRMIGGLIGLIIIDWRLSLLVVAIIPIRFIFIIGLAKRKRKLFEDYIGYQEAFASWYGDSIAGIKEIKLWGIGRIKIGNYIKKQRNIIKTNINISFNDKLNDISERLVFEFVTNVLYIIGAYFIINGSFTLGGLFAFINYSMHVTSPISSILNIVYNFSGILPSAKRLFGFFDTECEEDSKNQNNLPIAEGFKGNITFQDISFSYTTGEQVLKSLSFELKHGEKAAILGTNGSGKSTVINLLLRFYKPESGKILFNGIDIQDMNLKEYRSYISVVSQELYLFNTTVRENISLFSRMTDDEIHKAAIESGAHEFISSMPDGYYSVTGNNGANISGGQRQKIAVARALARKSGLLIMDEATSNYDMESEMLLHDMIKNKLEERTVILITHKPEILKHLDKIILIDNGSIVDIGTHEDLYHRNKLYKDMFNKAA
ncbi:MAG: ABC transporter ATP-binding protein/permease [Clostridia bacterium]|nr:ABC transporter ATP-binding protein/permease [Clostridia bacterium]